MEELNNNIINSEDSIIQTVPSLPDKPKTPQKTNIFKYLFIFFILLVVSSSFYLLLKDKIFLVKKDTNNNSKITQINSETEEINKTDNSISDIKNELFTAISKDFKTLDIAIFDPKTDKVINSKKITLDDYLTSATSSSSFASNDAVQYNPKTKEIFYLTQGYEDYGGTCVNKDGTCLSRIYKIGLNDPKPVLVFESEDMPSNWIINDVDNSLLVSLVKFGEEQKTQTIKKISLESNDVIFTKNYQIKRSIDLHSLVISKNKEYTYQTSIETIDGKVFDQILTLRTINNNNGDISEQKIFTGDDIFIDTDISPDNNYLAFYSGYREPRKLYIYNISTKEISNLTADPSNLNLFWSGDSKKLLFWDEATWTKGTLNYYDVTTKIKNPIVMDIKKENEIYIYEWAPSTNYLTYRSDGNLVVKDLQSDKVINASIKTPLSSMNVVKWY